MPSCEAWCKTSLKCKVCDVQNVFALEWAISLIFHSNRIFEQWQHNYWFGKSSKSILEFDIDRIRDNPVWKFFNGNNWDSGDNDNNDDNDEGKESSNNDNNNDNDYL